MGVYISDIKSAILFFPLVAAALTLPFLVREYRKFGSVPWFHALLVYLFVFYMLCCYFLVLLPLPADHSAVVSYAAHPQLYPFNWVPKLLKDVHLSISNPETWIQAICHPSFYEQIFNIFMLVPLGMFVRYVFRLRWWQCWLVGLGVSLSFETLQITGIFGWYEHPYRLFDVDDLITNSLGALLGCLIMMPAAKLLPDLRLVAEEAREVGVRASVAQRSVSFFIDSALVVVLSLVGQIVMLKAVNYLHMKTTEDGIAAAMVVILLFFDLLVFAVIPAMRKRQTPGQALCKLVIVRPDGQLARWYQPFARYAMLQVLISLPVVLPVVFGFFGLAGAEGTTADVSTMTDEEALADLGFFLFWMLACVVLVVQLLARAIVAAVKKRPFVMVNGLLTNTRVMTLEGARIEQERRQVMDVAEVIALEQRIAKEGTPLAVLMDRAGQAVATEVMNRVPDPKPIVIFAGSGNNGGDGWVAALALARKGYAVSLMTPKKAEEIQAQPAKGAALRTMQAKTDEKLPLTVFVNPESDVVEMAVGKCAAVVDAMLGTGFSGDSVREPYQSWINHANERRFGQRKVAYLHDPKRRFPHKLHRAPFALAVDTPSGLNAQTGAIAQPCFAADVTITMLAYKPGLIMDETTTYTGVVKMDRLGV